MVMIKNYVYRTQFPLILAYAVTIHKCQGLSLDCAIVDLSDKVFADGMAYVALSRVKSLEELHLIAFAPQSIRVNVKCLKEINRLREVYRNNLPLYNLRVPSVTRKHQFSALSENNKPAPKKRCVAKPVQKPSTGKRPRPTMDDNPGGKISNSKTEPNEKQSDAKGTTSVCSTNPPNNNRPGPSELAHVSQPEYVFYSVDEEWQRNTCATLGLVHVAPNRVGPGGPLVPLLQSSSRPKKKYKENCRRWKLPV